MSPIRTPEERERIRLLRSIDRRLALLTIEEEAAAAASGSLDEALDLLAALLDDLEEHRTPSGWDPAWLYPLSQRPDLVRVLLDAERQGES